MTEKISDPKRYYDILAAFAVFIGIIFVLGFLYILLGVCTHVLGMCSGASASWTSIYDSLLYIIPIFGFVAGYFTYKFLSENRKKKMMMIQTPQTDLKT